MKEFGGFDIASPSPTQQKLDTALLQNYMLSSVQSQASMMHSLFAACSERNNAALAMAVVRNASGVIRSRRL